MDEQEKRALFRDLRTRRNALATKDASHSSESDDIDSSSTESGPASPEQICDSLSLREKVSGTSSVASSDAETVEPDQYEPVHVPSQSSKLVHSVTGPALCDNLQSADPSSPSSSAETVPPPSPGTLARYQLASDAPLFSTSTASAPTYVRPVFATIDHDDIDDWDARQLAKKESEEMQNEGLSGSYPKFPSGKFKFNNDSSRLDRLQDVHLSDMSSTDDMTNFGVLPGGICKFLSPYQRDGVTFMYRLFERKRGGLLADAMGLGKTVQAVCFLGAAFSIWDRATREQSNDISDGSPKILVVTPASLRENWQNEFRVWTPFRTHVYDRCDEPNISRSLSRGAIDVLIAGTHPVSNYGKTYFSAPCGSKRKWKWDVIIVDEIHNAKNKRTKLYEALNTIPHTAMFGLTGTAVQNRLKELWTVMNLVVPKRLWPDERSFNNDYVEIITKGTKKDASPYLRRKANERIILLRSLLAKHIVRRPKSIIESHLPGKTDYCVLMRMKKDGLQGYMYQRFLNSYDVKLLRDAKRPCDCGSMEFSKDCCHRYPSTEYNLRNAPIWEMHHNGRGPCERCPNCICLYLQYYSRCLATHALLVMPEDSNIDQEKAGFRKRLFKYYLGSHDTRTLGPLVTQEQEADVSCKLNVALRLLKSYEASGHKTIIFYESLRLGSILQRWATNKGLVFEVIDGSVHKNERQGAVDRFNRNKVCSIFFISKKAGGVGLNIFGADRVLIFEPCWNPTLDLQAGDRAHRLGQKRVVHIIRLVVENTVEHYVFKTAVSKSQVSSAILDNTKEEWHIKENEVGSMQAMLSMGNVFSGKDTSQDEFRVVEAAEMEVENDGISKCSALENGLSNSSGKRTIDLDSQPEVDVLGDTVLCSLNVDVQDMAADVEDGFVSAADRVSPQISESQMETDILLQEEGACNKVVMQSTSARKRKRQVMGKERTRRMSGINADGANGVNFDDTSWTSIPVLSGSGVSQSKAGRHINDTQKEGTVCGEDDCRNVNTGAQRRSSAERERPKVVPTKPPLARKKIAKLRNVPEVSDSAAIKPRSAFSARAKVRR